MPIESITYEIECPCERQKSFPIRVKVKDQEAKVEKGDSTSLEVNCPICDCLVHVQLDRPLATDQFTFRGLKAK